MQKAMGERERERENEAEGATARRAVATETAVRLFLLASVVVVVAAGAQIGWCFGISTCWIAVLSPYFSARQPINKSAFLAAGYHRRYNRKKGRKKEREKVAWAPHSKFG